MIDHRRRARPAGSRPRTSSASVRTSPPPAPSARWADDARPRRRPSAAAASVAAGGEQLADPDLLDLLLGRAQPLDDVVDPLGQLLGPHLERLGQLGDEHVLAGQEPVGVAADQRLDPAYAGADRGLAEQLDHAELAGAAGVGAAAQLAGPVADRDRRAPRRRTSRRTAPSRRTSRPRPGVITSACTARSASTRSLTRASTSAITELGHRAGGGEVEPEPARARSPSPAWVAVSPSASRNALCTMWVAVCERRDRPAPLDVDQRLCAPTPTRDLAGEHLRLVHDQAGDRRLHVADLDPGAVVELDHALVGELAAALGVERGAVEHQLDLVALAGRLDRRRRRRRCRGPVPSVTTSS